jgi:hypothetical protein
MILNVMAGDERDIICLSSEPRTISVTPKK